MNEKEFLDWCKQEVCDYTNKHLDKTDKKEIAIDDVFMVWSCKTLQNNKALLSTTLFDGMYYECTYNGDKNKTSPKDWQKVVGTAIIDIGNGKKAEIHWYQCKDIGKVEYKIKRWL